MKKNVKFLLVLSIIFGFALYSCSSDNNFVEESTNSQIEKFNPEINNNKKGGSIDYTTSDGCAQMSGPPCVNVGRGNSATFTMSCENGADHILWQYEQGVGISSLLGPNGQGGFSQVFTFSSSFTGGWIQGVCEGSFGCKQNIQVVTCNNNPPPSCSITGPDCGVSGDVLNFSFTGNSNGQFITWSSNIPEVILTIGQGTNSASFEVTDSFDSGFITATIAGCSVNYPLSDCCEQNLRTIDNTSRILKNEK